MFEVNEQVGAVMKLEAAQALVRARCWGRCEGCGRFGVVQVHHRQARGMGGVSGPAGELANDPRNLLALCPACHDETEHSSTWTECERKGWRFRPGTPVAPLPAPAPVPTPQGHGPGPRPRTAGFPW